MNNRIDNIFRDKVAELNTVPKEVQWTPEKGWTHYQQTYNHSKTSLRRIALIATSTAAAIALIIVFAVNCNVFAPEVIALQNQTDSITEQRLPNGSRVWLNKNSSIAYSVRKSGEFIMDIDGEIYLETEGAAKAPYTLRAGNAIISIENKAALNIKAYPNDNDIDITVSRGSLKVADNILGQGLSLLVTKGNYCSVSRTNSLVFATSNNNPNYLAWKTGNIAFDNTPMIKVTQVLEKFYGQDIEIADDTIAYLSFTGTFTNLSLDSILAAIEDKTAIKATRLHGKVIISK
ncbi:FecR family protein [Perlabentimonas gracilis]|uniref:FecR family protein n=1 Tax=Perlabentimonas gracilis TaxID=2715279 RepID=UPI001409367B|nr:FecR domain-containing protein [Perlabentimonas gracilis]NHB68692.1 FecR family protein [Perlabentimonas gracilis]